MVGHDLSTFSWDVYAYSNSAYIDSIHRSLLSRHIRLNGTTTWTHPALAAQLGTAARRKRRMAFRVTPPKKKQASENCQWNQIDSLISIVLRVWFVLIQYCIEQWKSRCQTIYRWGKKAHTHTHTPIDIYWLLSFFCRTNFEPWPSYHIYTWYTVVNSIQSTVYSIQYTGYRIQYTVCIYYCISSYIIVYCRILSYIVVDCRILSYFSVTPSREV